MIKINFIICDDSKVFIDSLEMMLKNVIRGLSHECCLALKTTDANDLDKFIPTGAINIFFLDIDLQSQKTGIDAAKNIKAVDPNAYIIFMTDYSQYIFQVFNVHPFDFLPKPINEKMLEKCINDVINDVQMKDDLNNLHVKSGSITFLINKYEILYIEKVLNKCKIQTEKQVIETFETLSSFESKLSSDKQFKKCHKSFIVNTSKIVMKNLSKMELHMSNDYICPIGRLYKINFKISN